MAPLSAAARWSAPPRSNFSRSLKTTIFLPTSARGAPSFATGLEKLAPRFDFIRELRGEGLIQGIDLSVEGAPFVTEALASGLLINCTHEHILRLLPPFILRARDVAEFLKKFEAVLARAAKSAKPWPAPSSSSENASGADRRGRDEVKKMDTVTTPLSLKKDLLTGTEFSPALLRDFFGLAAEMKAHPERYRTSLAGQVFVLIFEKPSLRTRVTFETGIANLGGSSIFLDHTGAKMSDREPIRDIAKNLERWVQGIVARVFAQESLDELAANASIPVINALSDKFHPCQALADFFTLQERYGDLHGLQLAYVGDGNNMCHSLMNIGARCGAHVRVATPKGYEPDAAVVAESKRVARETHGKIEVMRSPEDAVSGAQAVYTDVWASMGQEAEAKKREKIFARYQVNETLFARALPDAVFLHCLPAHRGLEVTNGVIDSPRSIVYDQAENRLHVQKAVLHSLVNS